jgi:signal transduction histidine kinase
LIEASNGFEAIERTLAEHPDLTITDILMPEMDGYQLVRKLREVEGSKASKFIFYSATYLEGEAQALARACGVNRVICKPAEPEHILRVVDEVLASGQRSESSASPETAYHSEAIRVLNDKLYRKVEEVEELNRTLEMRIAERTRELENANRGLKDEILERQKAEADAAQSRDERLKMKGEFLSHVSHELRSPLAVVHQFATILLDGLGGSLTPYQREYLDIMLRNVNQLKYLIDDLLEASRAETSKLTIRRSSISAAEVVTQAVRTHAAAAKEKGIELKIESSGDLPPVYADPGRIGQVLTNLLDNAVKFSRTDTSITVRTELFADDPTFLLVSVADCGCGIEPENAKRVFERLYQVKDAIHATRRGLGLGLYICKELIDMHGGGIWVDSKRKAGTTIHFTLPIFTIKNLIAPIIVKEGQLASALILLTVEVRPSGPWQAERDHERMVHKVHQVLERCMLQDLDVLLPVQSKANSDLFSIVARTDQRGGDVMLSRFRNQLASSRELQAAGVSCSVASEVIDLGNLGKELPPEKCIAQVAASLKERLRIDTTRGGEHHDGKENNARGR